MSLAAIASIPAYNSFLTEPINFHGAEVTVNDAPGLGVDIDMDAVRAALSPGWEA